MRALLDFDIERDLNDLSNSELLVRAIGEDREVLFVEGRGWMRRRGALYERADGWALLFAGKVIRVLYGVAANISDEKARAALLRHTTASLRIERLRAMLALAAEAPQIRLKSSQVDCVHSLVGVENGVLDLDTAGLSPLWSKAGDRRAELDVVTRSCGTYFDGDAKCGRWEQFLNEVFDGDAGLVAYVQRAVGYALSGDISEHVLFFLHGGGANGKSVFLAVLKMLFGQYACTISSETLLASRNGQTQQNDLARLPGVRLAIASELDDGVRWNESLLKSVTGGDTVVARFLYREFFEFSPCFKLFIAGNHKPLVKGTDEGLWRRLQLIPFTVFFPPEKRDKDLVKKLCCELPGILNWALAGYRSWRISGLAPPAAVVAATADYRVEQDRVGEFLQERCRFDLTQKVQASKLYHAYKSWTEARGEFAMNMTRFGGRLTERGIEKKKIGVFFYCGVSLLPVDDSPKPSNPPNLL